MKPTRQIDMFDEPASRVARDAGIALVMANEAKSWSTKAIAVIAALPADWVGIGEDIRRLVHDAGIGNPHHPNCWGGLIITATRKNLIRRTGQLAPMKAVKSHARVSPILTRTSFSRDSG